jgi:hypothetical protein
MRWIAVLALVGLAACGVDAESDETAVTSSSSSTSAGEVAPALTLVAEIDEPPG